MSNKIANDLIRYAELVEDGALISPEEMNCASVMRLAAEALAQPAVTESHKQEPIGEVVTAGVIRWKDKYPSLGTKLYTTPPQRKEPEQEPVPAAMKTVIEAMQQDPDYAWGWHCNIAMSFVDAGGDHYTGNQGAARFMRTLANVEPAHELPFSPPQRKPLTDEMIVAGGKALAKLHAESCGLDFDDVWKYYAEDHKADAKAAIEAAHGIHPTGFKE